MCEREIQVIFFLFFLLSVSVIIVLNSAVRLVNSKDYTSPSSYYRIRWNSNLESKVETNAAKYCVRCGNASAHLPPF